MGQRILFAGCLASLVCWCGLTGCTRPVVREKPLADPLLTSKKPVEGKASLSGDRMPASTEQILPPPPPLDDMPPAGRVVRLLGVRAAQ